jgi:hypothetical protein
VVDFRRLKAQALRELPPSHVLRRAILALEDELPAARAFEAAVILLRLSAAA